MYVCCDVLLIPTPESPLQAQAPEGAAFGSDFEVTTAFLWGKFTLTSGHIGPRQNAMGAQRVQVPATLFPHLYHGLVRNVTVCSPRFSSGSHVAECGLHEVVSPIHPLAASPTPRPLSVTTPAYRFLAVQSTKPFLTFPLSSPHRCVSFWIPDDHARWQVSRKRLCPVCNGRGGLAKDMRPCRLCAVPNVQPFHSCEEPHTHANSHHHAHSSSYVPRTRTPVKVMLSSILWHQRPRRLSLLLRTIMP